MITVLGAILLNGGGARATGMAEAERSDLEAKFPFIVESFLGSK
jgi:hypothetical protein